MARRYHARELSAMFYEEMEARLLFSADHDALGLVALAGQDDVSPPTAADAVVDPLSSTAQEQGSEAGEYLRHDLVVIDARTPDYQALQEDILQRFGKGSEVVILDAYIDGIDQISALLRQRQDVDGIHIISHGRAGQVQLGSGWLDAGTLASRADVVSGWGESLSADADILIYGCDVAATSQGREMLAGLATLTGADVAASDDATGYAALGGDWDLEYEQGIIESTPLFTSYLRQSWQATLSTTTTFQNGTAQTGGVEDTYIDGDNGFLGLGDQTDENFNSSDVQVTSDNDENQGLLQFTALFGSGAIPSGATVSSATLTLYVTDNDDGDSWFDPGSKLNITMFEMQAAWDASTATWDNAAADVATATSTTAVATNLELRGGVGTFITIDVTSSLQNWAADPTSNHGWAFVDTDSDTNNELWGFHRSEDATYGPQLTVTYNSPPVITSASNVTVAENVGAGTTVHTVTATDVDGDGITYSINGGADAAHLQIDANSGALSFVANPDYEAPVDADGDNIYMVQVSVTDGLATISQDISITVTNENDNAPVFTNPAVHTIPENYSGSYQLTSTDADNPTSAPTYTIAGTGADDALFTVTASGVGSFNTSPDYENPADADGDNIYILDVRVSDGLNSTVQRHYITISNLNDNDPRLADDSVSLAENSNNGTVLLDVNDALTGTDLDRDGDTISYYIDSGNSDNIFTIDQSTGVLSVADNTLLDYETTSQYVLTIQANDGSRSDTARVTVNITNVNDNDPLLNDATVTLAENSSNGTLVTDINDANTAGDRDLDGDALTYAISSGNGSGAFAINSSSGVITVADANQLDYETTRQYSLVVTASDGSRSDSATITVNITNVNDNAPAISDASLTIQEDAANGYVVTNINDSSTGTDTDADGDTISYTITAGNSDNIFAIDGNGVLTVADNSNLDYESSQQYVLSIQASDGTYSDSATITVNVSNVNDNAPQLADSTVSLAEDAANGAPVTNINEANTGNDTDRDGEAVSYTITAGNGAGIFAINSSSGAITVADNSNLDYETSQQYVLTVAASDGLYSGTATITINITNVNDNSPLIIDQDVNLSETAANGTTVLDINDANSAGDTDADGDAISYAITAGNGEGVFAIDSISGVITVADNTNLDYDTGTRQYTLTVSAASLTETDTAQITVNVVSVNDIAPQIDDQTVSLAEDAAATTLVADFNDAGSGTDNDQEGDALTYSITAGNSANNFVIDSASGQVTVSNTASLDYETTGSYDLTIAATDGTYTDTAQLTVNITNVNDNAPLIVDGTATLSEDAANGTVLANFNDSASGTDTDRDGDGISYTITAGNDDNIFAINSSTGVVSVADNTNLDYETTASYNLTITATDGVFTDTAQLAVSVSNVNDNAPLIADSTASVAEDAANGTVVTDINDSNSGTDTDRDGDGISYTITAGNDDTIFTINSSGQIIVADNSNLDYETTTSYTLTISASDGTYSDTAQVAISVTNVNDNVPVLADMSASVAEDASNGTIVADVNEAVTGLDRDSDGEALTYAITAGNSDGIFAIDAASGVVTVADNSNLDYETSSSCVLTVAASDGTSTDTARLTVSITNVNDITPQIDDITISISEDAANGTSLADIDDVTGGDTDADGDPLYYTITSGNDDNIFAVAPYTGEVTVVNNSNLDYETTSQYVLTLLAEDGVYRDTAQITINVLPVNDNAPQITSPAARTVAENSTAVGQISVSDADLPGDSFTYAVSGGADSALFQIDASGNLRFGTAPDYENPADADSDNVYNVQVTVSDGVHSASQDLAVTVTDQNEFVVGPVSDADGGTNSVQENAATGSSVGLTALAADADSADSVTYSLSDDAGGLFAIDANSGVVTVASASLDYESATSHSITVRATSSDSSTSSQVFTIAVTDVNEYAVGAVSDSNGAIDSVVENAGVGTAVGITAVATDADGSASVTYSLTDDGGGRFAIDPASGLVTVAGPLDFESATSHQITVLATSSDGSTSSRSFTITVVDQAETPAPDPVDDATPDTTPDDTLTTDDGSTGGTEPAADPEPSPQPLFADGGEVSPPSSLLHDDDNDIETLPQDFSALHSTAYSPRQTAGVQQVADTVIHALREDEQNPRLQQSGSENDHDQSETGGSERDSAVDGAIDEMRQQLDEQFSQNTRQHTMTSLVSKGVPATLAAGVAGYLLRAGSVMSSFMASVPLWKGFDPIAILILPWKKRKKKAEQEESQPPKSEVEQMFAHKREGDG